jgi:hypothetical protein
LTRCLGRTPAPEHPAGMRQRMPPARPPGRQRGPGRRTCLGGRRVPWSPCERDPLATRMCWGARIGRRRGASARHAGEQDDRQGQQGTPEGVLNGTAYIARRGLHVAEVSDG